MQGGAYMNLAIDIENGDVSSYEWDVQTDGNYDDSYDSYASYSFDYDIEEVKMHEKVLMQILNSRDYKIQLRRNLLQQPQSVVDTDYFLTMEAMLLFLILLIFYLKRVLNEMVERRDFFHLT